VNLRLRRIEHVGIHFANNVKYHSSNGDENNQQPAHRSGAKNMVRDTGKGRELACSESTKKLVDNKKYKVKANGKDGNSNPRIRHSTVKTFSNVFAAR
jgi:hypothetical protein